MTKEEKWLRGNRPYLMLRLLPGRPSERKLRLFACACVRQVWHLLREPRSRRAVEMAERYADGQTDAAQLAVFRSGAWAGWDADRDPDELFGVEDRAGNPAATPEDCARRAAEQTLLPNIQRACWAADNAAWALASARLGLAYNRAREAECELLRCIFGNPFQPAVIERDWLSWHGYLVRTLAQTIYEERRWEDLPILADALEEAGCDNADMLAHCRGTGGHVRGCWVVDTVLGKE